MLIIHPAHVLLWQRGSDDATCERGAARWRRAAALFDQFVYASSYEMITIVGTSHGPLHIS